MNAKIVLALALALPLSAQAQPQISNIDPVSVVAQKGLIRGLLPQRLGLFLDRIEVARGLGRSWSPGMNLLRDEANPQAAQVCREGWPAVKFTFIRGKTRQTWPSSPVTRTTGLPRPRRLRRHCILRVVMGANNGVRD